MSSTTVNVDTHLRTQRDAGRKLLVVYVTAGAREDWLEIVQAVSLAGADAIEIGLPFSDPVMDGPVIQAADVSALRRGTTPTSVLNELGAISLDIPLVVMTYYNLVFRFGHERLAKALSDAGITGAIIPDLPMEHDDGWVDAAAANDIATVMLVAPNTRDARLAQLCERSRGFVYAIGVLGVTGARSELADSAVVIAKRAKAVTDKPVLVGVGVSNPEQAKAAVQEADGVIIGSAVVKAMTDGASPAEIGELVASFRIALDS